MAMKKQEILTYCKYGVSRKHLNSFGLFTFLIITFFVSPTQVGFAQDCKTRAANTASTLVRGTDDYFDYSHHTQKPAKWDVTKIKLQLAKAESWMKNRLTGFTGAKLWYYNTYWLDYVVSEEGTGSDVTFYKATGIKSFYSSEMMFFANYCYDNKNTMYTEDESGSNIQVIFNNIFFSGLTTDVGVYTINAKPAFKIIQKKRSEGRIDFYEQRSQNNANSETFTANDFIILRNSDKPVFLPIARKEYLEQMLKYVQTSFTKDSKTFSDMYNLNLKQFEAEMKVYKEKDKTYTPEKEAKRRKWFEEDQEKLRKTISKLSPNADAAKAEIQQYLKKPTEWLSRSFNNFYSGSTYTAKGVSQYFEGMDKPTLNGAGEVEEVTQEEVVSINPAYFNKILSSDVPQLILVHLQNGTYAHMLKVGRLVKQPTALAPLESMLNSR